MAVELKGLKALQGLDPLLASTQATNVAKQSIINIDIDRLSPGQYQPRSVMDRDALNELAASIKVDGIIQPLIVRKLKDNRYEIIAGERRWQASKIAGLTHVPVILRDVPDKTALAFALIENIQRESLNPMDEALSLIRLKEEFGMTHEEIAERVGRSRSAVSNLMRLDALEEAVKEMVRAKKLEMGHARALLSLTLDKQIDIANIIVAKKLSVREAEKLVQKQQNQIDSPKSNISTEFRSKVTEWEKKIPYQLSNSVNILVNERGKGRIVISFNSLDEGEWIVENLSFKKE